MFINVAVAGASHVPQIRHVNAAEVVETGGLLTRKREIERLRMLQVNAEKITLQTAAEQLLAEGADAVSQLAQPVIKTKKVASRRNLRPSEAQRLQEELAKIGCFGDKSGRTRLCKDYNVFINSEKLSIALLKYRRKPAKLHQAVLKLALPEKILRLDGISRTGKKGCVGISSDITESITLYVSAVYRAAGGDVAEIDYDPDAKLKNLLDAALVAGHLCGALIR
ncbi:uncharacterized protein LOC117644226 [Thrips palmi]|uniref:Uncharacterized protein LOC117644226 n=1 Tax=Thrips palmi TaxID=161013 RepID=A0A6P8YQZ0_THRPL|nr:uncharacterized protein LOC117644226 [Thrips palmi]